MNKRTGAEEKEYETMAIENINKWKNKEPSAVSKKMSWLAAPLSRAMGKVIPDGAVKKSLEGLNWFAGSLTGESDILKDAGVNSIEELKKRKLSECDSLQSGIRNWAIAYCSAEGAAAGLLGIGGAALDIPALITLALRTIRKTGYCYGYNGNSEEDRSFILGVLSLASSNTVKEKLEAMLVLKNIETVLMKSTWKEISARAGSHAIGAEGAVLLIKNLAGQVGINLTKRKALQAIPVVGAAVGALVNAAYITDVALAAKYSFQERWLLERGRI